MSFIEGPCGDFVDMLASKSPVPGGGGASALVGAVGMALGSMVGSLTVGKKKYAGVESDIISLMSKAAELQAELLRLVDEDAVAFEPLSKAYGIPKDDPGRATTMEDALKLACMVPLEIMRSCAEAIRLHEEFAEKGTSIAISDVGVGVAMCKAALQGASLNVFINTQSMTDREHAAKTESEADTLLETYCALADKIYSSVTAKLRKPS